MTTIQEHVQSSIPKKKLDKTFLPNSSAHTYAKGLVALTMSLTSTK